MPTGRLTLGSLWQELPARAFNLERGLLHTFVDLWRRPGRTARDFVAGRRSPFVTPLTYFLVGAAVQLLALSWAGEDMRRQMEERVHQNPQLLERLTLTLGEDPAPTFAELYFGLIQQGYTTLFLLFMSVPFAVYLCVLARRIEPRYNLAETLIFALFTTGHLVLVTAFLVPITGRVDMGLHGVLSMSFYGIYTGFAARGFYDGGVGRVVATLVALVLALATLAVVLLTAFSWVLARHGAALAAAG